MSAICIIESDKITVGSNLMQNNTDLVEWNSNLSNLINGQYMFDGCTNLTTFSSDLSSLINGEYMFTNCNLSIESVENIANSLPTVSDNNSLHLGVDLSSVPSTYAAVEKPSWTVEWYENPELEYFIPHLQTIVNKGWVVTLNNKPLEEWTYFYNPTDPT